LEKLISLLYNYSFASAVQRRIEKLKLALPWYFKSLKMEKNWEGSAKVFGDVLFSPSTQTPMMNNGWKSLGEFYFFLKVS
jgi:hypothetical protein